MSGDQPVIPASLRPMVSFTADELKDMKTNMEAWLADPQKLREWLQTQSLLHLQVLNHLITHPPGGRSGSNIVKNAIKDFTKTAADVMKLITTLSKEPYGERESVGDDLGEGCERCIDEHPPARSPRARKT